MFFCVWLLLPSTFLRLIHVVACSSTSFLYSQIIFHCMDILLQYFKTYSIRSLLHHYIFFFWMRWVFAAVRGLSLVAVSGLCCGAWASHCSGFSCCRTGTLGAWASVVVARGLSSCGTGAELLCGMWDLPGPGIEPVSPALAGGFLTAAPPGKSPVLHI